MVSCSQRHAGADFWVYRRNREQGLLGVSQEAEHQLLSPREYLREEAGDRTFRSEVALGLRSGEEMM